MKMPHSVVQRLRAVFEGTELGDPRRSKRLDKVVARLARKPGATLPDIFKTEAELEGAYRLANNDAVDPQSLMDASASATAKRADAAGSVLVIHDTTTCSFAHAAPEEVGFLATGKAGFLAHVSLVLDADVWRRPLGVAHVETISRKQRSKRGKKKATGAETARWKDRESARWERGVEAAEDLLQGCPGVCHVADREGDSYAFLASMAMKERTFVVRVRHDRKVGDPDVLSEQWLPLKERVRGLEGVLERDVELSRRRGSSAPRKNKAHPPRKARLARLSFSATTVVLNRPRYLEDPIPKTLTLNVVHVSEPNPPPGELAVEWLLFTTLSVDTEKQITKVVDIYRARWAIEEFNKALKSGCAYESREFESLHALLVVLAISIPIASELLWLRSRARTQPNAPASDVLSPMQIKVLRKMGSRRLPSRPTAHHALWAVAGLGGHQKRNGEPGWTVLYRGMQTLLAYEAAYEVGREDGEKAARRR